MDRAWLTRVAVAGLALLAVGLTVTLAGRNLRHDGPGVGEDRGFTPWQGEGAGELSIPAIGETILSLILAILIILALLSILFGSVGRTRAVGVGIIATLLLIALWFYFVGDIGPVEWPGGNRTGGGGSGNLSGPDGSDGGGDGSERRPALPRTPIWGGLIVVAIVLLVAAVRAGTRETAAAMADPEEETDEAESELADEEVAAAARRAADHLAGGDTDAAAFENDVYRAWHEMTQLLELEDPGSSTPGEFADAAIAAGLDAEDVTTLTRLFEEVRYGGRPPDAREADAIAALRSIEAAHGGGA